MWSVVRTVQNFTKFITAVWILPDMNFGGNLEELWFSSMCFQIWCNCSFWLAWITSLCPRSEYLMGKNCIIFITSASLLSIKNHSHFTVLIFGLKLQCAHFVWFPWKTYILKSSALWTLEKSLAHPFPRLLFTMDSYLILQSKVKLFPLPLHL